MDELKNLKHIITGVRDSYERRYKIAVENGLGTMINYYNERLKKLNKILKIL